MSAPVSTAGRGLPPTYPVCGSTRVLVPSSFDRAGAWRCWQCGATWWADQTDPMGHDRKGRPHEH